MRNKKTLAGLATLAALLSSAAFAQAPSAQMPQRAATAAPAAAPVAGAAATVFSAPSAVQATLAEPPASPLASHRALLGQINETKAKIDLRKVQGDLEKLEGGSGSNSASPSKKEDAGNVLAALEQAKKEQLSPQLNLGSAAAVEQAPPITLLATFAMEGVRNSYAEVKVGDLIVRPRVGERLPSGEYVRAIDFDYIEVSKLAKSKKTKRVYISASEAAAVYGGLGRSGQSFDAGSPTGSAPAGGSFGSPSGLPPMIQGR